MSQKPASTSAQKTLEANKFEQSASNPSTWKQKDTEREVTSSGNYIQEKGTTGWKNISNKKKL